MRSNRKQAGVLLIGAGAMGIEYAKVLDALNLNFITVGRGRGSANNFSKITGKPVITGGFNSWLKKNSKLPEFSIVAAGEKELGKITLSLIKSRARKILVEKPGGFRAKEIKMVASVAKKRKAEVFVGYNRRFYASVARARQIIKKDGGALSFNFEFTEWSQVIAKLKKASGVKKNWLLHNSTHVIDLAFFLAGGRGLKKIASYKQGGLDWHPDGAVFAGAGICENGALFSYQANWMAPGRWGVEVLTKKHRLIFRPLEELRIQKTGSVAVEKVVLGDKKDKLFKPGLYNQVEAFIKGARGTICSIQEQAQNIKIYDKILTG